MWKGHKKERKESSSQPFTKVDASHTKFARSTMLEWQFPSEEQQWERAVAPQSNATGDPCAGMANGRKLQALSALLMLMAIGATLYLWWQAERGAQMLEEELRAAIAAEAQPSQHTTAGDQTNSALLVPANRVEAQDITFQGNFVSVQVESTHTGANGESYTMRQRRFYLGTESGWVVVPPSSEILGSLQSYETDFFAFSYFKIDEASVKAVAAEVDATYVQLRRDYGLPPTPKHLTIVLLGDPAKVEFACYKPDHLCLHSPALAELPIGLLESDALRLWLLNVIVYQVYWDAIRTNPLRYEWHDTEFVLPRLQMRQHSALLSAWHTDMVRWLYAILTRTPMPDAETLEQELEELCARHQIMALRDFFKGGTMLSLCASPQMLNLLVLTYYESPEQVSSIRMPDPDLRMSDRSWGGDQTWIDILEVEILLDYIVAIYGREVLPALVEGFRSHSSWNTLVPAVFGISIEEFEQGWHQYLQSLL